MSYKKLRYDERELQFTYKKKRPTVKIPVGRDIWSTAGLNIETYIAIAMQPNIQEVANMPYKYMIKSTDLDLTACGSIICGTNNAHTKNPKSFRQSMNKGARCALGESEYSPINVVKVYTQDEYRETNWIMLDFEPNDVCKCFVDVEVDILAKILPLCNTQMELVTYLTILALTRAKKPKYGLLITPTMYSERYIKFHSRNIIDSITNLLNCNLLEGFSCQRGLITFRNVQTRDLTKWLDLYNAGEHMRPNPCIEVERSVYKV